MTDRDAERMVSENTRLVWSQVHWARRRGSRYTSEELYSLGIWAMYKAAKKYRPEMGQFSTLATLAIRNEYRKQNKIDHAQKVIPADLRVSLDAAHEGDFGDGPHGLMDVLRAPGLGPEEALLIKERDAKLYEALGMLNERERDAIISYYINDEGWREISDRHRCTRQGAQQQAARGLKKLRGMLACSLQAGEISI